MKWFFFFIVILHGSIHVLGFLKAFELAEINQLAQGISKSMGMLWILAAIFFLAAAIQFVIKHDLWWITAFIGVTLSQILIIMFWQDAKFGTIPNLIILVAVILAYASWGYANKFKKDVKLSFNQENYFQESILTETDIQDLPEPVKKYLRYTKSIGKLKVNNFKVLLTGKIRKNEQTEWMSFSSKQYNFLKKLTRLFFMNAEMKHLPVTGYHRFINGDAFMDIRLLSLFRVQYQDGKEMDISETVTFFNDMCCMAPATLIDKRINWLEANGNTVKASFTNNNITIYATLYFNDSGELVNFISNDRYSFDAGTVLPWSTPMKNYKEFNGFMLPTFAKAIYSYPESELCYGTFQIEDIEYNCQPPK